MDRDEMELMYDLYMDLIFKIKYPTNIEDLQKIIRINEREIYVEYCNGNKYIIDVLEGDIANINEDENEISEEYDKEYFCKRFNKILYYKNITQLELSNMTRNKL